MFDKAVNVVNVNEREFFIDNYDTFLQMLESLGISKGDVYTYLTEEGNPVYDEAYNDIREDISRNGLAAVGLDGLAGDAYINFDYELRGIYNEIDEVMSCLLAPSRKGNTKADIYKRLKVAFDELGDML